MAEDATYQTLVYHEREGDVYVVKSDGIIRGHSGGIISMESGFKFNLASQDILGKDMARVVHSWNDVYEIIPSLAISVLAISNVPKNVKNVVIYGSVDASQASIWMTSCSAGAELFLHLRGDSTGTFTNNNTSVYVSCSGCIILGSVGAEVSSLELHTSANSDCAVHFIAIQDNVWSIVSQFGDANVENNEL